MCHNYSLVLWTSVVWNVCKNQRTSWLRESTAHSFILPRGCCPTGNVTVICRFFFKALVKNSHDKFYSQLQGILLIFLSFIVKIVHLGQIKMKVKTAPLKNAMIQFLGQSCQTRVLKCVHRSTRATRTERKKTGEKKTKRTHSAYRKLIHFTLLLSFAALRCQKKKYDTKGFPYPVSWKICNWSRVIEQLCSEGECVSVMF